MKNLVRLSKINSIPDFPIRASTAYKWNHLGLYPKLFVTLSPRLVFLDRDELEKILESGRGKASPVRKGGK
jgi:hypothetical protein